MINTANIRTRSRSIKESVFNRPPVTGVHQIGIPTDLVIPFDQ